MSFAISSQYADFSDPVLTKVDLKIRDSETAKDNEEDQPCSCLLVSMVDVWGLLGNPRGKAIYSDMIINRCKFRLKTR